MALFGNFQDIAFPEILQLLMRKEGRLLIEHPTRPFTVVAVKDGRVEAVWEAKRALDALEARAVLMELLDLKEGRFEFRSDSVPKGFGWPIESVLLSAVSMQDEIRANRQRLPHPQTRFIWEKSGEIELDEALLSFVKTARGHLAQPVSVEELSKALHLGHEHTGYFLYKLRLLGCVDVARQVPQIPRNDEGGRHLGTWSRLVAGVRRLLGGGA